jgi:diguanylate cyclase (GGDEF)-like protein
MITAPVPTNELARIEELLDLNILDSLPEQAYDDITYLASRICDTPIALVSLVDSERQWFKSRVGLDATQTSRDVAFCAHAILEPSELFVVRDATVDLRFANNPLVVEEPAVRFYAGAPLVSSAGNALGTLCVIDNHPRELTEVQTRSLQALARQVMAQLELRTTVAQLHHKTAQQQEYERQLEEYQRTLEANLSMFGRLSVTDPLTGLNNRRSLMDRLDDEFSRLTRSNDELTFALIDIDHFKHQNDTKGHPAGDGVLEKAARLIENEIRSADFVARYGGDEFAVIFCNTDTNGARVLAERVRRAVERGAWGEGGITVSIGIAAAGDAVTTPAALIAAADHAMYRAKAAGRNRVAVAGDA